MLGLGLGKGIVLSSGLKLVIRLLCGIDGGANVMEAPSPLFGMSLIWHQQHCGINSAD